VLSLSPPPAGPFPLESRCPSTIFQLPGSIMTNRCIDLMGGGGGALPSDLPICRAAPVTVRDGRLDLQRLTAVSCSGSTERGRGLLRGRQLDKLVTIPLQRPRSGLQLTNRQLDSGQAARAALLLRLPVAIPPSPRPGACLSSPPSSGSDGDRHGAGCCFLHPVVGQSRASAWLPFPAGPISSCAMGIGEQFAMAALPVGGQAKRCTPQVAQPRRSRPPELRRDSARNSCGWRLVRRWPGGPRRTPGRWPQGCGPVTASQRSETILARNSEQAPTRARDWCCWRYSGAARRSTASPRNFEPVS